MHSVSLNGTWDLTYGMQRNEETIPPHDWPTIPAQVPGNVELDLMNAKVLPDLAMGNNIYLLRQYEGFEWWYHRRFQRPVLQEGQRVDLVFDGLDCVADVWLNDVHLGHAENMLVPQRFDATAALGRAAAEGHGELRVRIKSAVLEGRKTVPEPLNSAFATNWESLGVRKAPHMYGWDIMPRIVSAGLWRDVRLQILDATHWRSVYWATLKVDTERRTATVLVDWDFVTHRTNVDDLHVRVQIGTQVFGYPVLGTHGRARIVLQDVDMWWPQGYGQPVLYDAVVELVDGQDHTLDIQRCRIGLRTIDLHYTDVTTPAKPGEFVFVVNGEKVFAKGTNWVPLDALHSRDRLHLPAAMEMVQDLNCNMIRCWGGNVYEDDAFFDRCDELGVMVWQDFALACAIYPQTNEFATVIQSEAELVVTRLRNHASLALWAGNNEIDETYGWSGSGLDPNTDRLSREVLPSVIRRLDPHRPYLPSSPYRSPAYVQVQQEINQHPDPYNAQPEQHLWGPRDDYKGPFYLKSLAHFASEIGYHGCPDQRSLSEFVDGAHVWPWQDNDQWTTHSTRPHPLMTDFNYRIELMSKQIKVLFDSVPTSLDEYVLASQISQAEAVKFFIEWFRQAKWRRTGILWWNLRDGWPIISDAIVDYYGRKKLAYEYVKRVQANVFVMVSEPQNGVYGVVAVNDTLHDETGHVKVWDVDSHAVMLDVDFHVSQNDKCLVGEISAGLGQGIWVIDYTYRDQAMRNHYLYGSRPFKLTDYRRWLADLDVPPDVGPTAR